MMAGVYAVLPVKSLRYGKRRLSQVLSPAERYALMRHLYMVSLSALQDVLSAQQIIVVSCDSEVLALAEKRGVRAVRQSGYGLNAAVRQGETVAMQSGAAALLVLLADLPLVTGSEIRQLLGRSSGGRQVVIVPGQRGGTHVLLVCPPGWFRFGFGEGSFERHKTSVTRAGGSMVVHTSAALALDVDLPEDLPSILCARPSLLAQAAHG